MPIPQPTCKCGKPTLLNCDKCGPCAMKSGDGEVVEHHIDGQHLHMIARCIQMTLAASGATVAEALAALIFVREAIEEAIGADYAEFQTPPSTSTSKPN
jgi:hypothetical protein